VTDQLEPKTDPGRKKILVVDDDTTVRAMLMLMLRACNVKVIDARNGQEGLAIAELMKPQLILLDLTMPVMDGTAVVKAIRAHADAYVKTIPIVIFSASPMSMRKAALEAGANAVLEKPCPKGILLQFVEMYLGPVCGGKP